MGDDDQPKRSMGDHNGSQVALVLINSLMFITAAAMMHLWAFPQYAGGIFKNNYLNLTLSYEIPVTPSEWTAVLWTFVFFWLLLCKVYTWVLLCRKNAVGPAYKSPPVIGHWFLFTYTLALFCLIAWTIVWDRDLPIPATVLIFLAAIFCWCATAALYKSVHFHGAWMARHSKPDLWLYRMLWHNGMAAFTTWVTVNAIYLLGITLRVEAGLSLQEIVYIVMGSILGVMVVWALLEHTVLDRFARYTFLHYIVIVVLMAGVYSRQYKNTNDQTSYIIIAVLATSIFCLVLRILLAIVRGIRCPLYRNNKISEDPVIGFAE